jgi:predicted dehydrogenase
LEYRLAYLYYTSMASLIMDTRTTDRRYDSDFRTLESLFTAKVFGEILEAEFHHDVDAPSWAVKDTGPDWHPGEGMAFGIGCHSLDQALALFGRPSTVTAFYRTLRPFPSKAEDSFTMVLQYKGTDEQEKRIVWIKTNSYSKMIPLKYFIRGREGTFIKFGEDPQEQQTYTGQSPAESSFGVEDPSIHGELSTSRKVLDGQHGLDGKELWVGKVPSHRGDYAFFYTDLVAAIRGERELKVKPETSRDGIQIIELARLSAASGQTIMFS